MTEEEHKAFHEEMAELKQELQNGLNSMLGEIGTKLKPHEVEIIKKEVGDLNELIDRLATGLIWIALFGKVNAGKSSVANALINMDEADVGIEHDLTAAVTYYVKKPWNIGDVPGIMGKAVNKKLALVEAKKAHGHIFVIDGEPFEEEIALFDFVAEQMPSAPRIVFVNKADLFDHMPRKNAEIVKGLIYDKMRKYVKSDNDIVYGSAQLFDRSLDQMVRQPIPQLEDALRGDTSSLGALVNVYVPANRALALSNDVRSLILESRRKVARKIINGYALAEIGLIAVPFSAVAVTPGLLTHLTYSLIKIMGTKDDPNFDKVRVFKDILRVCVEFLALDFVAMAAIDTAADFLGFGFGGAILDLMGLSYFKYRRTLIFGEAVLLYIENGFTFGDDARGMVMKAKQSAAEHYEKFKNRN